MLWCGSFNAWTDVELLFAALSRAMDQSPQLEFVAVGGAVRGHDEKTFARFQRLVGGSPHAARIKLLGWVPSETVDALLLECDLGINIDSRNNETFFGARNRIATMLACGLPVLSTLGAEISHELNRLELGLFVELGDQDALVEAMLYGLSRREELAELGRRGREFALRAYSREETTRECLQWLAAPRLAPDNAARLEVREPNWPLQLTPLNELERKWAILEQHPLSSLLRDRRELQAIRSCGVFRLAKALKSVMCRKSAAGPKA